VTATTKSPEARLYAAGFTRQLEFWLSPDGHRVLNLDDAIAALDSGAINPAAGVEFPDSGVRAHPRFPSGVSDGEDASRLPVR
jgi:hypothetical protein